MCCPRLARCDFGVDAKRSGAGFPGRRERVRRVSRLFPFGRRRDFLCADEAQARGGGKRTAVRAICAARLRRRRFSAGGSAGAAFMLRRNTRLRLRCANVGLCLGRRQGGKAALSRGRAEERAARSFAGRHHTSSSSVSSSCSLRPPPNMGEPKSARR